MTKPTFDEKGNDATTFAPFILRDCRATEWADVRLEFSNWDFVHGLAGGDSLDGYYLNGYGVEGLVKAVMDRAGIDVEGDGIETNSEGDTCYLHFKDLDLAVQAATEAQKIMTSREALAEAAALARAKGFED